jgi:hypothetical protein
MGERTMFCSGLQRARASLLEAQAAIENASDWIDICNPRRETAERDAQIRVEAAHDEVTRTINILNEILKRAAQGRP